MPATSKPRVHAIADAALGNTSYLVDLGDGTAVSVDPRRDVGEHLDLAASLGARVVAVAETHLHADFVSGARELVAVTGAEVLASREAGLALAHRGLADGEERRWGAIALRAIATPGHTPEHVAYVLVEGDREVALFTGGSITAGGAARTDLIDPEATETLARAQYRSFRRLAAFPDAMVLHPTHGGGSFCAAVSGGGGATTLGDQRRDNPLLAARDEDEFVARLLAGYGSFPRYFLRLRRVNRDGPPLVADLEPPRPLAPRQVAAEMDAGAWLVDVRPLDRWAAGHPRGAVSIELRDAFASWLGWVVPWDAPVVLLGDARDVERAVVLARRIGYDRIVGWLDAPPDTWAAAGLPVQGTGLVGARDAARRVQDGAAVLLDVRQHSEVIEARVPGARHVELGDLAAGKLPEVAVEVVTVCSHGQRAATAASLLERHGVRASVLVGGLEAWEQAGLPVQR